MLTYHAVETATPSETVFALMRDTSVLNDQYPNFADQISPLLIAPQLGYSFDYQQAVDTVYNSPDAFNRTETLPDEDEDIGRIRE